jgi:type IV pilus assembly protein PilV
VFTLVKQLRFSAYLPRLKERGFTLLEVMIALVILAIGVMGVIGMQMSTYKQLQTSHNFSKAAMLAGEMADRMLANVDQVTAGNYTHDAPTSKPSPDCANTACTQTELAAYDVWMWQAQIAAQDPNDESKKLPGALPSASGAVQVQDGEYIVIVRWDDDLDGDEETTCAALDGAIQGPDDLDCYALNLGCMGVACP